VILDEPFSGLDPVNSNLIKDEIFNLAKKGTTIIFSTHRMEQVEEICDHIVLVNKGHKILDGSVKQIKQQFKQHIFNAEIDRLPATLQHPSFSIVKQDGNNLTLKINEGYQSNDILLHFINQAHLLQDNLKPLLLNTLLYE
jgi:ABC-2 type transport system ATP-binding protein